MRRGVPVRGLLDDPIPDWVASDLVSAARECDHQRLATQPDVAGKIVLVFPPVHGGIIVACPIVFEPDGASSAWAHSFWWMRRAISAVMARIAPSGIRVPSGWAWP